MFHRLFSNSLIIHAALTQPGACFSKDTVITGPDNLPGRLTGNFTGPGIAFLEAPVNFPDTGPAKIVGRYQSLTRALRSSAREGERFGTLRIRYIRF